MATSGKAKFSYLKRIFLVTHAAGLGAGAVFPFLAVPILGRGILTLPFFVICLLMGLALGSSLFLFMRATFKAFLRGQLDLLRPLAGAAAAAGDSEEELLQTVETVIGRIDGVLKTLFATVEELAPHYRNLARSGQYLHDRAHEGLSAAVKTHEDVKGMEEKQRQIAEQMEVLSGRTQDEAALSRELSASLEEMAGAMEHSAAQFLETTSAVDEVASTVREASGRANEIARSVEGTSQDLDRIGETLEKIRTGASASAQAVDEVKKDAENGLLVVKASMEEMERIEQESQKATEAMERLSRQTGEVAKIIEVIKELVSDTELLAFNAAIIAAKAGEEGKGFSVVAEEIRDLADRTTASAQDIHRIVKNIGGDTREVTSAVDATAMRIAKGKQMSLSAGEALTKIAASSSRAADSSEEIASLTEAQGERARSLLVDVGRSLRSVQAVARAMQEQQIAIARIQEGVNQMKSAADQVGRGMEEQVKANREFDRGLEERESQIQAINEATRFQLETSQRVFAHFAKSQDRLRTNAERAAALSREIALLESLTNRLRTHAADSADLRAENGPAPAPSPAV